MTDQYAVFGNPIAHSKSPSIHKLFAEQTKQDIEYTKQLVELGQFANEAKKFFDAGGKGLNVTVPFKLDAYKFVSEHDPKQLSETALLAGAVNTLKKNPDGSIFGHNTDGIGLIRDLENNYPLNNLVGQSVFILGAGGAVRGVLSEILRAGVSEIVIVNRTESKTAEAVQAAELAKDFNKIQRQVTIRGGGYHELGKSPVDIIINGTSASLSGEKLQLPDELLPANTICYDMMYGREDTAFMQWAKKQGVKKENVLNGLGMLVEQAAESFCLWRNVNYEQLNTKDVIEKIRKEL